MTKVIRVCMEFCKRNWSLCGLKIRSKTLKTLSVLYCSTQKVTLYAVWVTLVLMVCHLLETEAKPPPPPPPPWWFSFWRFSVKEFIGAVLHPLIPLVRPAIGQKKAPTTLRWKNLNVEFYTTLRRRASVFKFLRFEELPFRVWDGLVWTEGLTEVIKFSFLIPPAQCAGWDLKIQ